MGFFMGLVLVLGVIVLCNAQINDYCQTPRNQQGECKVITECQALLSLLANKPIRTQDADFLKRSQCGFEGTLPKVCCALGGANQAPTTEKPSSVDAGNVASNLLPSNEICGGDNQDRIYGGQEAGLNEYPWMALVEYERENGKRGFYCGGVLISKRYILTAAHCLKGKDLPRTWKLVSVRLGEHNLDNETDCADLGFREVCSPPPVNVPVEERIAHEDYEPNDPNQYHDIAILRLAREVQYTESVKPVCLPKTSFERQRDLVGQKLVVAGWGKTENRSESPVKLKLNVPVKANDICVRTYNRANVNLSKSQLCAGGEKGKDSCRGDSGGPLMHLSADENGEIVWYAVGVVSFGPSPCGMQGWPGVYTKVADYVPWIVSKMRP